MLLVYEQSFRPSALPVFDTGFFAGEGDLIVISYSGFSIVCLLVERKGNILYICHDCLQMDGSACGKS